MVTRLHDLARSWRWRHARHAAFLADVGGHALQRHHRAGAGLFGDLGLLGVGDVHDDAALQHLRQADLHAKRIVLIVHLVSLSLNSQTMAGAGSALRARQRRFQFAPETLRPDAPRRLRIRSGGSPAKLNRRLARLGARDREVAARQVRHARALRPAPATRRRPAAPAAAPTDSCRPAAG